MGPKKTRQDPIEEAIELERNLGRVLSGPLFLAITALVAKPKDWPTGTVLGDTLVIVGWFLGLISLVGVALLLSKKSKLRRLSLLIIVTVSLAGLSMTFLLRQYAVVYIDVRWPTKIYLHEAVVGGSYLNLDPSKNTIRLYVCTQTRVGPKCFLDQHFATTRMANGYWESAVRFGNEVGPLNEAPVIEFFVLAVAGSQGFKSAIPAGMDGTIRDLLGTLQDIRGLVLSEPFRVERIVSPSAAITIQQITHDPKRLTIEIPPPRKPFYFVCPPISLSWNSQVFIEVWYDGRRPEPYPYPETGTRIEMPEWPAGVDLVEVKISEARGGPYDNVYMRRTCESN